MTLPLFSSCLFLSRGGTHARPSSVPSSNNQRITDRVIARGIRVRISPFLKRISPEFFPPENASRVYTKLRTHEIIKQNLSEILGGGCLLSPQKRMLFVFARNYKMMRQSFRHGSTDYFQAKFLRPGHPRPPFLLTTPFFACTYPAAPPPRRTKRDKRLNNRPTNQSRSTTVGKTVGENLFVSPCVYTYIYEYQEKHVSQFRVLFIPKARSLGR